MKTLFITLLFLHSSLFGAFSLKENFKKAAPGDYALFEQGKMVSLFLLREVEEKRLLIEEVSFPEARRKTISDLQEWLMKKAPGHTSWVIYEIDLEHEEMVEAFSFSRGGWLILSDESSLLSKLLSLKLSELPSHQRRKVGSLMDGQADHRPLWSPPLIIEGKRVGSVQAEVFAATWKEDGSILSGKKVELYFDHEKRSFLPFWIQISSNSVTRAMKALDLGHNLKSPYPAKIPRRYPKFIGKLEKDIDGFFTTIECPRYFQNFTLYALCDEGESYEIPFTKHELDKEKIGLDLDFNSLETGKSYKLMLIPKLNQEYFTISPSFVFSQTP